MCNLHNGVQTLGVSLQLTSLTISAFVASKSESSTLLECGCVDIGTICSDMILREQCEAMPQRQQDFLHRADRRMKRLYFVWEEDIPCGCCGGCQFLNGVALRPESKAHSIFHFSRYFCNLQPIVSQGNGCSQYPENVGCIHSFSNLSSLEQLHKVLLIHYHIREDTSTNTKILLQSVTNEELSHGLEEEALSQGSDSSFVSARESLSSLNDIEQFKSVHNSPQVTEKHTKHKRKPSDLSVGYLSPRMKPKPQHFNFFSLSPAYRNTLDSYECNMKKIKVFSALPKQSVLARQDRLSHPALIPMKSAPCDLGATKICSSQHEHSHKNNHTYLLQLPTMVHSQTGCMPVLVSSDSTFSMGIASRRQKTPAHHHSPRLQEQDGEEQALSMLSVSVKIAGSFGVFVSPPLISVAERYWNMIEISTFSSTKVLHY